MRIISLFIVIGLFISCSSIKPSTDSQDDLNKDWVFQEKGSMEQYPASVPGSVHLDLLNNDLIPEPFYSDHENQLKWIEEKDWIYQSQFKVAEIDLKNDKIYLIFEGLDTYAEVFLNDQLILSSENMFVQHQVDVKGIVAEQNQLRVEFQSAVKTGEVLYDSHSIKLPAGNDRNDKATSVFSRKAPYQFGWDWGPRLVGVGIWKPIYLEFWRDMEVVGNRLYQKSLTTEKAEIALDLDINTSFEQMAVVDIYMNESKLESKEIKLQQGVNHIEEVYQIEKPKLWWPNGAGEAYLYDFKVKITGEDSNWEKEYRIGFRDIKLERKKDSIGESFQFVVNGVPIYMKGANYIPQDAFPSRVTEEDYQKTIQLTKEAHMNMLRIWGGGIYEMDTFYDLCDENGILIWQDFMFACSLYPGDDEFLENVEEEAIYQIKRIRDHACLALWCGNNENNELWHNWGYQKAFNYSAQDSIDTWNDYLKLFDDLLPKLVNTLDPNTNYLESSPVLGWGREESMTHGDSHYWGIWWGKQPFEMYEEKVPRFSSEFGFQSIPHLNTVLSFTDSSQLDLFSVDMKAHQKSSIGNQTILDYLPQYYPEPNNFTEMIYISQLLQAYGMDLAFRAQRIAKPRCMGTLYWQLNDCWPVLSWSSIDYYHQKKATHYIAQQDFANYMIQSEIKNEKLICTLVSDSLDDIKAHLQVDILSFTGDTIKRVNQEVNIAANQMIEFELSDFKIRQAHPGKSFIYSILSINDKVLAEHVDFFSKPKNLQLPASDLHIEERGPNQFEITSEKSVFHYSVALSTEAFGNFEPNFFHLLPGETIEVKFYPNEKDKSIPKEQINILTLNQIIQKKATIK